jgi:predicted GIY-YIG superfamily endonuclease
MPTYSNTTAFAPSVGSMAINAFGRCGIRRTMLTAEHMADAQDIRTFGDHGFVPHYDAPRLTWVYRLVNLVNGKTYIGITSKSVRERLWRHRTRANLGKPSVLMSAMRKYGADMFRATAVAVCTSVRAAMEEEKRLIALWHPEYNMTKGGEGVWGFKPTPEQIERVASKNRGRRGAPCPDWLKEKNRQLRFADRGVRKWSDASRPTMLAVARMANAARRRPVVCMETAERFESVTEAAKRFGITTGMISHSIKVGWRVHGKWTFERPEPTP